MHVRSTALDGVLLIEPTVHRDGRGFFVESYNERRYREHGIAASFVQDNHSLSRRNTLRGLHAQVEHPQGKLVRASRGEVFDVAVDIRPGSASFGRWVGAHLTADNFLQMYVPAGFAHGFCVLSEVAEVQYKCTDYHNPGDEIIIAWDDPQIGIQWPLNNPTLSPKDARAGSLQNLAERISATRGPECEPRP